MPSASFAIGILAADCFRSLPFFLLLFFLFFLLRLFSKKNFIIVPVLFAALGGTLLLFQLPPPASGKLVELTNQEQKEVYRGIVREQQSLASQKTDLKIDLQAVRKGDPWQSLTETIRLTTPAALKNLTGETVLFRTKLRGLHSFQNFGDFDTARYFQRKGILASGYLAEADEILSLSEKKTTGFIERGRQKIIRLANVIQQKRGRAFVKSILVDDRS
ncbi:MAG: ComEC/Rec2 family competence protein, partial [bacterium]|nr:ComEC/Rec2 family competence protein [bacterium]